MKKVSVRVGETWTYMLLGVVAFGGYLFSFELQENFYRLPNHYFELERLLQFQTSWTSFWAPWMGMMLACAAVSAFSDIFSNEEFLKRVPVLKVLLRGRIAETIGSGFVLFMSIEHDLEQEMLQPYPDNNFLDVIMALFAWGLTLALIAYMRRRERQMNGPA